MLNIVIFIFSFDKIDRTRHIHYIIFHRMRFDERTETYRRWCRDSS